jgi:hypothetical protein
MSLTRSHQKLVSKNIAKEFRLKKSAEKKRASGRILSKIEKRRIKRSAKQMKRIAFEISREENPDIPEV